MTEKSENPPAFPLHGAGYFEPAPGMSLRDYFAGQVIAGMYSNRTYNFTTIPASADKAYQQADAMLAARAKREPKP